MPSSPRAATATACRARSITPTRSTTRELERIWHGGWLFAGFTFEIPKPGDYLTFSVGGTSVLVMRDDDGAGARVPQRLPAPRHACSAATRRGTCARIVCPYHSWTYSRQGDLIACHGMHEGVDKSKLGLKPLHAEVVAGLIYVSLAATPPAFAPVREFAPAAMPQGFDRARRSRR